MAEKFNPDEVFGNLVISNIRNYISSGDGSGYRSFMEMVDGEMDKTVPSHLSDRVLAYLTPILEELEQEYNSMMEARSGPEPTVVDDPATFGHVGRMNRSFRNSKERGKERPSGAGWIRMG